MTTSITFEEQQKKFSELDNRKNKLVQEGIEINTRIELAKTEYKKLAEQANQKFGTADPEKIEEQANAQKEANQSILNNAENELNQLASTIAATREQMQRIIAS